MLALGMGMPPLGQQRRLEERPNAPGERLLPPSKKRARLVANEDRARIAAAEAKRERKARKRELDAQMTRIGQDAARAAIQTRCDPQIAAVTWPMYAAGQLHERARPCR